MKHQKSCGPCLGKLVHQLPGVITFASDLHFRHMISHWKDLSEEYNIPQKCHLGPQNNSRSSGPEKLLKIVNCAETKKRKEEMVGIQVE